MNIDILQPIFIQADIYVFSVYKINHMYRSVKNKELLCTVSMALCIMCWLHLLEMNTMTRLSRYLCCSNLIYLPCLPNMSISVKCLYWLAYFHLLLASTTTLLRLLNTITVVTTINFSCKRRNRNEPPHDKTNKMACAPSEDSDQPGHPPSLIIVFAVRMKKAWILSYPLSAQRRLRSDWADAQRRLRSDWADGKADLSLRWAHGHFVGFVMRRLKSFCHETLRW